MALCCNQAWPFLLIAQPSLGFPHLTLLVVSICAALASPCLSCTSLPISLPPLLFITHTLQLSTAL